ncbi:unnamed protein product [Phytophthora fragariaefolia]|uniref:Unnamed protein product n=1 Tax=Phytophthora fragariaefolia TaxID=1490495 RepID=A0A9W6Y4R4_9STRA|nr:unnamed protein product [Phytophthora fragariaefolia]
MSDIIDEVAHAKADVPAPAPVVSHKRIDMARETEEKVAAVAAKGDGETKSLGGETEPLALMRGITERLDRLEESQAKLVKTLEGDRAKGERKMGPIQTPSMDTSLFQHGYGGELSEPQWLYATAQARAQSQQRTPPAPQHQAVAAQPGVGQQRFRYPGARQKKVVIRAYNGKALYVSLGSGFLEWSRRFEMQVTLAQSAGGFLWPEDVKVDLLGSYLSAGIPSIVIPTDRIHAHA